jgi:aromatic ring-opening dioxygenase catalytic subunit (LigB family)
MPTIFIPHGAGPCFFMDWSPRDAWTKMGKYLQGIASTLSRQPKAIVIVSAHWLESGFVTTGGVQPEMIFDYNGFPPHTYELKYPAPGAPLLAAEIERLIANAQLVGGINTHRGFDHGMFIPLMMMFPEAKIPVVQLSLRNDLDPQAHFKAGRALESLRDQDILILGSGMSYHNMRGYGNPASFAPATEFDTWLAQTVALTAAQRYEALSAWAGAPSARLAHPAYQEEHLLPLMVVAGAAGNDMGRCVFTDKVLEVPLSGYQFG